ncbi:MAG TPA: flagellar hook capping FlgD N-terminal domain-containing protein, partial [Devosia sp.]|nr:flagellar hook capping FlgD N-terminal domain-containing protein [Devosia sp.]
MASNPVDAIGGSSTGTSSTQTTQSATDAFGLGFEDLLKIVLTQLTYQDPLKPMDNFQFVSQLAQFSQIQQTQQMADNLRTLVTAQSS